MRRALIWLNLCGREAVRHKLKNRPKMHFFCFLAIFELISDSLTAISVEQNQCPSHQSILLTQGPIHEILMKIAQLLEVVEKLSFFESAILNFFFRKKNFFFASIFFKLVIVYGIPRMGRNFDDYPGFQLKTTHAN